MEYVYYTIQLKGFFVKEYEISMNDIVVLNAKKIGFFGIGDYDISNSSGETLLQIRKPFHFFKRRFNLIVGSQKIAEVNAAPFSRTYQLLSEELQLETKGNFWGKEFTVLDGEIEIAKMIREGFFTENTYKIAIQKGYNELLILAMVICISVERRMKRRKG